MSKPTIPSAVAALVGTSNLDAAVPALIRKYASTWRELHTRVVKRTGKKKAVIADANPNKSGAQKATIALTPASSDWQKLGAQIAANVTIHKAGAAYLDELQRMMTGAPIKKLEGGEDDSVWQAPTEREAFIIGAVAKARGNLPAQLDPVTLGVIGSIIIASIPFVLPILFTLGEKAFTFASEKINEAIGNATDTDAEAPPPPPPPPPMSERILSFFADNGLMLGAAAVAAAAIVWAIKRR